MTVCRANDPIVVRLASFGAGEIASEAIWIDANRSNEARRTTTAYPVWLIAYKQSIHPDGWNYEL